MESVSMEPTISGQDNDEYLPRYTRVSQMSPGFSDSRSFFAYFGNRADLTHLHRHLYLPIH